jgi:hypothetical protein
MKNFRSAMVSSLDILADGIFDLYLFEFALLDFTSVYSQHLHKLISSYSLKV